MRDVEYDPKEESAYECFSCGTIVIAETNPGSCDDCGSEMRNRLMPIE
jgi:rubrerythrin